MFVLTTATRPAKGKVKCPLLTLSRGAVELRRRVVVAAPLLSLFVCIARKGFGEKLSSEAF